MVKTKLTAAPLWTPGSRYLPELDGFVPREFIDQAARRVARARKRYAYADGLQATVLAPPEGPFVLSGPATDVEANKLRHTAAAFRRMLDATMDQSQGVIYQLNNAAQDLLVKASGVADGFVHVPAGSAVIRGTQAAGPQGMYHLYNDATLDINVLGANPAHATLDRIDLVVARIQDTFYSGSNDLPTIEMVTGTPAGSPVAPAAPANSLILAQISIIHATTTIPSTAITDRRVPAGRRPVLFDEQSAAGPTASVTIIVPPGFDIIQLFLTARLDVASNQQWLMQFNGDTGGNYDSQAKFAQGNVTAMTDASQSAATAMQLSHISRSDATAGDLGICRVTILNASSLTLRKDIEFQGGGKLGVDGVANQILNWGIGDWRNVTGAISSILLKSSSGNLISWKTRAVGVPS